MTLFYILLLNNHLASEALRTVLYLDPHFAAAKETHLRLALVYKATDNWHLAIKHLKAALLDVCGRCTLTDPEIYFHLAHCEDARGSLLEAKDQYTNILNNNPPEALSATLKACIFRQLGWLYYRCNSTDAAARQTELQQALQLLTESIKHDPSCGKSYYYLGRCYSALPNHAHDAFVNYRQSIDKAEANADTWCSIGVLYQQQQQPMDAVQAFICAVQLDSTHTAAWTDLGLLYENFNQFHDALQCYQRATKKPSEHSDALRQRINILERELQATKLPRARTPMPSLEEAWSLPIPSELILRQRGDLQKTQKRYAEGSPHLDVEYEKGLDGKGLEKGQLPSFYMDAQRVELLRVLDNADKNGSVLSPDQACTLAKLRQNFANMQQHMALVQKNSIQKNHVPATKKDGTDLAHISADDLDDVFGTCQHEAPSTSSKRHAFDDSIPNEDLMIGGIHDTSLKDARKQEKMDESPMLSSASAHSRDKQASNYTDIPPQSQQSSTQQTDLKPEEEKHRLHLKPVTLNLLASLKAPLNIGGREVVQMCHDRAIATSMNEWRPVFDEHPVPPAPPPRPARHVEAENALMPTPTIIVDSKKDANSAELQQFCYDRQVALVKGLTTSLRIDLSFFSTKTLAEVAPSHQVEVRTQLKMGADANTDASGQETWKFASAKSFTTIGSYAKYQAASFQQAYKEEKERLTTPHYSQHTKDAQARNIKFGTNVDLSDERRWAVQLAEVQKLPPFCRLHAGCNSLTHTGHPIYGMNTVQLYMKVPGCRTPGHRENNNLCAINVNIGPGECEWFCVDDEYWGEMHRQCRRHGIDFLKGSWWPALRDLAAARIPIYRFTQKAGDMVWLGPGVIHWVHSTGWCNNIAWNVGPCTTHQLRQAIIAYEWNKLQSYKSIVPLIHLFWQLARNIKFTQARCLEVVRGVLIRSLAHCRQQIEYVQTTLGKTVREQARTENEWSHYCAICEHETWNVLVVSENAAGKYVVHCMHCALQIDPHLDTFHVLQQYRTEELIDIIDRCTLTCATNTAPIANGSVLSNKPSTPAHLQQSYIIC